MVSSEIGTGTSYINVAGETGLVVPPDDPASLRSAMQFLWEHPEWAAGMGALARERFDKHFTADKMMAAYAKLYRQLLKK
jgi:glycosyltransferase involved in cell wall biosynthesis